jgi:hypothetical protein
MSYMSVLVDLLIFCAILGFGTSAWALWDYFRGDCSKFSTEPVKKTPLDELEKILSHTKVAMVVVLLGFGLDFLRTVKDPGPDNIALSLVVLSAEVLLFSVTLCLSQEIKSRKQEQVSEPVTSE